MNWNKRKEGESFKDYRKRLKGEQLALKFRRRRGILFWDSMKNGTYAPNNPSTIRNQAEYRRKH